MKIAIAELRIAIDRVLVELSKHGSEVEIPVDFYWDVPFSLRYDNYNKPEELTLGQLSDDWCEVKRVLDPQCDPVPYTLVWAAALLRRIGEQS